MALDLGVGAAAVALGHVEGVDVERLRAGLELAVALELAGDALLAEDLDHRGTVFRELLGELAHTLDLDAGDRADTVLVEGLLREGDGLVGEAELVHLLGEVPGDEGVDLTGLGHHELVALGLDGVVGVERLHDRAAAAVVGDHEDLGLVGDVHDAELAALRDELLLAITGHERVQDVVELSDRLGIVADDLVEALLGLEDDHVVDAEGHVELEGLVGRGLGFVGVEVQLEAFLVLRGGHAADLPRVDVVAENGAQRQGQGQTVHGNSRLTGCGPRKALC